MAGTVKVARGRRAIPLPQPGPCEDDREEEDQQKLKEEQTTPDSSMPSPDKDLGLESPLMLKAQSPSTAMSEKLVEEELLEASGPFGKGPPTDLLIKESSEHYGPPSSEHVAQISEERWALDALRNLDLLKQLLMQQLGLSEKEALEDHQHFSRHRTVSQGAQVETSVQRISRHLFSKTSPPGVSRIPSGTGTSTCEPCYGHQTSGEFLQLGDTTSSNSQLTDPLSTNPDIPVTELEGVGAEDSGEHFFDAREGHSDENQSEGEVAERKEEEEVQLRISGNYLILDGYSTMQESSTDEEVSSLTQRSTAGSGATDSAPQQRTSLPDTQSDRGSSLFVEEFMASHWEAAEEPSSGVPSPPFSVESCAQIMRYIQKIAADLERLKEVEENYATLQQRLAGSAPANEHSDKS